jgi:hypothetical protein
MEPSEPKTEAGLWFLAQVKVGIISAHGVFIFTVVVGVSTLAGLDWAVPWYSAPGYMNTRHRIN